VVSVLYVLVVFDLCFFVLSQLLMFMVCCGERHALKPCTLATISLPEQGNMSNMFSGITCAWLRHVATLNATDTGCLMPPMPNARCMQCEMMRHARMTCALQVHVLRSHTIGVRGRAWTVSMPFAGMLGEVLRMCVCVTGSPLCLALALRLSAVGV
jgi:hypothetical protein